MAEGAELAKSGKFLKNTGPMPAHFCSIITSHYSFFVKYVAGRILLNFPASVLYSNHYEQPIIIIDHGATAPCG